MMSTLPIELETRTVERVHAAGLWYPVLDEVCVRTAAMWDACRDAPEALPDAFRALADLAPIYAQLDYDRSAGTAILVGTPSALRDTLAFEPHPC